MKAMKRLLIGGGAATATAALVTAGPHVWTAATHGDTQPSKQLVALAANAGLSTPDAQVRAAVAKALRVHQALPVPPGAANHPDPTAAELDAEGTNGKAAIADAFAGAQSDREQAGLTHALALEKTGHFRALGGGTENLIFKSVAVADTSATATGTVDTWSKMQFKNPNGAWLAPNTPRNTLVFTITLQRGSTGRWKVTDFTWDFTPATSP